MKFLLIFAGGGVGAILRYFFSTLFPHSFNNGYVFPLGTLVVNIIASFILGALLAMDLFNNLTDESKLLVGTGFCGALSTYSTFAVESLKLFKEKYYFLFILNVLLNNILSIGFAALGYLSIKFIWNKT